MSERIIRPRELPSIVGISKRHAARLEADGNFPRSVPLCGEHGRARGYLLSELEKWINERAAEREGAV